MASLPSTSSSRRERLDRDGFRCVAFVHDEVIVEIPISADHTSEAKEIDRILGESMAELTGEIPIACEYSLTDRWYKSAEAVFADGGKQRLWKPRSSPRRIRLSGSAETD